MRQQQQTAVLLLLGHLLAAAQQQQQQQRQSLLHHYLARLFPRLLPSRAGIGRSHRSQQAPLNQHHQNDLALLLHHLQAPLLLPRPNHPFRPAARLLLWQQRRLQQRQQGVR